MRTQELIKEKGRLLFNKMGVKNVTLRDVAGKLGKSYGNITYHFPNKEKLVTELFTDINNELGALQTMYDPRKGLLRFFLSLPEHSFDITLKYLFFSKDYVELKRTYPEFFVMVHSLNEARKSNWLKLLVQLQSEGSLKKDLSIKDLEYIMDLSVGIRMFYFQSNEWNEYDKDVYITKVNRLLYPYLSTDGVKVFEEFSLKSKS